MEYFPLDVSKDEIRLLELIPVVHGNETWPPAETVQIQCKLRHASLRDDLDYAAVSYVWAEVPGTHAIDVDGHTVDITKNLWALLKQFRSGTSLILWVDALCINQKDDREKSEQVAKMESIYKRAREVMIWLGPPRDGSDFAMDLFNEFSKLHDIVSQVHDVHLYGSTDALSGPMAEIAEALVHRFGDKPDTTATPLLKLFHERQWWARVWIIQEFVLARQATFYCGDRSVTGLGLVKALAIIKCMKRAVGEQRQRVTPSNAPQMSDPGLNELIKDAIRDGTFLRVALATPIMATGHLMKMLVLYQHCSTSKEFISLADVYKLAKADNHINATNPRDHVYGLLGLVSREHKADVLVDYSRPVGEIFALATAAIMRVDGADSLSFARRGHRCEQGRVCALDLFPSWSAEWFGLHYAPIHQKGQFHAGRHLEFDYSSISPVGTTIKIPGVFVDTILQTGSHRGFHPEGHLEPLPSHFQDWVKEAVSLVPAAVPLGPSVPDVEEALWRIPILDHILAGSDGPPMRVTRDHKYGYDVLRGFIEPPGDVGDQAEWQLQQSATYLQSIKIGARRSFATAMGFLGLAPDGVRPGDMVCILAEAQTPFVLRAATNGHHYLIGECYVQGIMYGEWKHNEQDVVSFELC